LLTSLVPLLSGLSTTAAQIVDPSYYVNPSANYYFMIASTFLVVGVGTFVTSKFVEPRLGKWNPQDKTGSSDTGMGDLKVAERKGLWAAGAVFVLSLIGIAFLAFPENAILRDPEEGLKPFYHSLVPIIMLVFFLCGVVYGMVTRTIQSDRDIANMTAETMGTMGAYIVLAFVAAQFVAYFSWSNLGVILAITGANSMKAIGFTGIPLILSFMLVSTLINIFIGSASAKWAVMGPVFVPMLMLMGYSPE